MSDNLSSEEDIPPTPQPSTSRLNVVMFRQVKRRIITEYEDSSDSSDSAKKRKTVEICSDSEHTKKVRKNVRQCTGEKIKTRSSKLTPSSDRVEHTDTVKYPKEKKNPKKVSLNPSGKKRLRKLVRCKECDVPQQNIWRHMRRTHGTILATREADRIISPKVYVTYICPAFRKSAPRTKCGKIVTRLRDYLLRSHGIPNGSAKLRNLMAKAEPFKKPKVVEEETIVISSDSDKDNTSTDGDNMDTYIVKPVKQEDILSYQFALTQASERESVETEYIVKTVEKGDETVDQFASTQPVRRQSVDKTSKSSGCELFVHNSTMRAFTNYLQEKGMKTRDSMQTGAEAFYVWNNMDKHTTLHGLLNQRFLDTWIEQSMEANRSFSSIIKFLTSLVQLIQFVIRKGYIVLFDVIMAKQMIDKIGMATKYLKKDIANQQSDPENDGGAESAHSEVESGTIGQPVTDPESGVEQSDVNQTENCGDIGEKDVDIILLITLDQFFKN